MTTEVTDPAYAEIGALGAAPLWRYYGNLFPPQPRIPAWISRSSNRSQTHARDIALRRRAEQATVLPTELRGALVPHAPAGAARVQVLVQHQLPCLL